jgi:RNA polymerase sigma-70 factor, ECF subfamily
VHSTGHSSGRNHASLVDRSGQRPFEIELIARAKAGDRDAFGELYKRYYGRVLGFALRRLQGDLPGAEDLTSETFLAAFCKICSFHGAVPFDTWLESLAQFNLICQRYQATAIPLIEDVQQRRAAA